MGAAHIPINELALAYELRCEGATWKRIGVGLGYDPVDLYNAVRRMRRHGLYDRRVRIAPQQIAEAVEMRAASRLSWGAIGRYLGIPAHAIECAVWRHKQKSQVTQ